MGFHLLDDTVAPGAAGRLGRSAPVPADKNGTGATFLCSILSAKYFDSDSRLYYYGYRWHGPGLGRFISYDPAGQAASPNLFAFPRNSPLNLIDPNGLWGADIHRDATIRWAVDLGYPDHAAEAIGKADLNVDGVLGFGTGPLPFYGTQGYHFDRNRGRGKDTRFKYYEVHLKNAKDYCTKPNDDPDAASRELGTALHPYQDWVAHGDFGFTDDGEIGIDGAHNINSPQGPIWGAVWSYPDNPMLDAIDGPNGRPAAPAMNAVIINYGLSVREYAIFEFGVKRYRLTKSITEDVLHDFRKHVQQYSVQNCKCWTYYGISSMK